MKVLLVLMLFVLPCAGSAQEVYKWEDEKGVLHYGEKPAHPTAMPLEKDKVPYSTTEGTLSESPTEGKTRIHRESDEVWTSESGRQPRPSPSLSQTKATLAANGRLRLSGVIRNGGKGLCEAPTVEVVLFDDNGSVDGNFETAASPNGIERGQEARFEGEYFTPVGELVSWDVIPRCDSAEGAVYGNHKGGSLKLKQSRTLRLRTFKTR